MEFETILSLAGTLVMLIALQAVLGFDNLLYTSLWNPKKLQKINKLKSEKLELELL